MDRGWYHRNMCILKDHKILQTTVSEKEHVISPEKIKTNTLTIHLKKPQQPQHVPI